MRKPTGRNATLFVRIKPEAYQKMKALVKKFRVSKSTIVEFLLIETSSNIDENKLIKYVASTLEPSPLAQGEPVVKNDKEESLDHGRI